MPYLVEIMDALNDPAVHEIVFQKCARIGGTQAGLNMLGRIMDCDPGPCMYLWPTLDDARKFSELELIPMIRDCAGLATKIDITQPNNTRNKTLRKQFPGGYLILVGSNSPSGLSQVTIRNLFADEIDRYATGAGDEGDPLALARVRTTTFADSKIFMASSPTIKGKSVIEREYENSDQRIFEIPCPHCGEFQELSFRNLKWDDTESPAFYACQFCAEVIEHPQKREMVAAGQWKARQPFKGRAGFRLNCLVSPWVTWDEVRDRFVQAKKDPLELRVFVNTFLGETYDEEEQIKIDVTDLQLRQEEYHCEAPEGVLCIVAGCDVQKDRVEIAVLGYGKDFEIWFLDYHVCFGDPLKDEVWIQVEKCLLRKYQAAQGELGISVAFLDAGDGNRTAEVYRFCHRHLKRRRRWYACKGASTPARPVLAKPTLQGQGNERTLHFLVGTNTVKDTLSAALQVTEPGPRCIHFPKFTPDRYFQFTENWFRQLRGEYPKEEFYKGRPVRRWIKISPKRKVEAWDCFVYAHAALIHLNPNLEALEKARIEVQRQKLEKVEIPPSNPPQRPTRKKNFLNSWR